MRKIVSLIFLVVGLWGCRTNQESKLFKIHEGPSLGIDFQNTIQTNDTLNALTFEYIYNGSGIGIGDFNNDGLEDIFFGGNQVSSELYLNEGALKFRKVTKEAGLSTSRWVTGVSVVDINQDGWMDVYLCVGGKTSRENRRNLLFVNQGLKNGVPVFEEMAAEYGLDDDHYSTMAAFFDYDKDGDLDMYLLNNWLESFNRNNIRARRVNGEAESNDCMYRNDGNNKFTNISREAGILIEGYGLGVNISDLNQDSWPDIYVANDFLSSDLIWINQQDGTFKEVAGQYLNHQSHNGMGVDVADFNNDALADIMVVDMLPEDHKRQKLMTPGQNYDHFHSAVRLGYQPQYMRNTLQLNRGEDNKGNVRFSEISFLAGVAKTDWSWAPLFADFDNDGWKDLFIANGYRKDVTNLDFIFFGLQNENPFGTPEARKSISTEEFNKIEDVKLSNQVFRNTKTLQFENATKEWGFDLPTFSNGAVYADFDNDGDLDLVMNNIDQDVVLYENQATGLLKNHFIKIKFDGPLTYNQKVSVFTNGISQIIEATPYRGFESSVTTHLHFGIGDATTIDSLKVFWPDKREIVLYNLKADTMLMIAKAASRNVSPTTPSVPEIQFEEKSLFQFTHQERSPSDIKTIRTLLHEPTKNGPCVARGDVNNDGLDDLYIGGEDRIAGKLYVQQSDGSFKTHIIHSDSSREDGGAVFFDADNDQDLDLYIASACTSIYNEAAEHLLFLNDGNGKFTRSFNIPGIKVSASCVVAGDYDNDGDIDLFIGGNMSAREYPIAPRSFVLQNDNGKFKDVTEQLNPSLTNPGMVTSALLVDLNKDSRIDLVLAGDWMPIRVFMNAGKSFVEETHKFGLAGTDGWWKCLASADLNNDGFPEIIAGNNGKNSFFNPTSEEPVMMVAKDFDRNGFIDPVVTYYNPVDKDRFVIHNRLVLIEQIPIIKKRFETFTQFATTPFSKTLTKEDLQDSWQGKVNITASICLINKNGDSFEQMELPETIQLSTLNDIVISDLNSDGHLDIIGIGNHYNQETLFGRFDASYGTILLGDGNFNWTTLKNTDSNFIVSGDCRNIDQLRTPAGKIFIITKNNDSAQFLKMRQNGLL